MWPYIIIKQLTKCHWTKHLIHHLYVVKYPEVWNLIYLQRKFHKNSRTMHLFCYNQYQKYLCNIFLLWAYPLYANYQDKSLLRQYLVDSFLVETREILLHGLVFWGPDIVKIFYERPSWHVNKCPNLEK